MSDVVGPVPAGEDPEAYDRLRRRILWAMPAGLYVLGSVAETDGVARHNLMTADWVQQVAVRPKLVAASIDATAVTCDLVGRGGVFSVSLLDREDRAVVRKFGKPVADVETDDDGRPVRMAGVTVVVAATGAPILASAACWLDCEVRQQLELGSHVLFVGEVVAAGGDPERPLLRMEDTRMNYGG